MAPTEEEALNTVYYLTSDATKNWRRLLKYAETLDLELKRKLLWMWPTENCLLGIREILNELGITCLLSIGCGNGLFEWLLRESLSKSYNLFNSTVQTKIFKVKFSHFRYSNLWFGSRSSMVV